MIHPDEEVVFEPTLYWIGDWPLSHGERDVPYGHEEYTACLCGVKYYLMCPSYDGPGSLLDMDSDAPWKGLTDE